MEIAVTKSPVQADTTAFAVLDPVESLADPRLGPLLDAGEVSGASGATAVLHTDDGRLVAAGGGRRDQLDADSIRDAAAGVARLGFGGTIAWLLDPSLPLSTAEQARAVVDGLVFGGYDPGKWKTSATPRQQPSRVTFIGADDATHQLAQRAELVAQWANRARDLSNRPANDLTPERLTQLVQSARHAVEATS